MEQLFNNWINSEQNFGSYLKNFLDSKELTPVERELSTAIFMCIDCDVALIRLFKDVYKN